jgi:hypothetical protein
LHGERPMNLIVLAVLTVLLPLYLITAVKR